MSEPILEHYGVKRRSGRYPWGSGKDPQRSKDILSKVDELRGKGFNEKQIAEAMGMNTADLRKQIAWANNVRKQVLMDSVQSMKKRGETNTRIAESLGISEASVRNYSTIQDQNMSKQLDNISDVLKNRIDEVEYLDVGVGVERQLGISRDKLKTAIAMLKEEGYYEHEVYIKRLNDPDKSITIKVLSKEPELSKVVENSEKIRPVDSWTDDGGLTFQNLQPIQHVDWDRVAIRYGDKGGEDKDGVIELRRGVEDLDLGNSNYAQVRIGVGGSHYLKGMAVYSDDLPKGKDILFNTNKPSGTHREEVLKKLKDNPDNPFGATISRQNKALNIVNEEGDWNSWKSTLSAQFLSKQPTKLVKDRLDATYAKVESDFNEIMSLTNPIVKKHLLEAYANEVDAKSKHLKVQGLPRTKGHVILPYPEMKPNEVYAPNYKNGERVVLVRYPHGGTFELPELTVNNKGPAKNSLKNAIDAIGIHPSVASKLSGADFDGDTVYVIPNNKKQIKTSKTLKELRNFDPNHYKVDHPTITKRYQQTQMGMVSNLITDMTIKGAPQSEIARAVKHSMVVIDAEKHKLDYKKSAADNGIRALQKKYQTHISQVDGKKHVSASTIISRSKRQMGDVDDARKLSSGTTVENLYANYANKLKAINNRALKESATIKNIKRDPNMAKLYSNEVKSLNDKLNTALLNAPRERQAQLLASKTYYKNLNYDMSKDDKKKLKNQALIAAREKTGASRKLIDITDKEWKAIQSGAISNNMLEKILLNTDMDKVKKLATPKALPKMSSAKATRARTMLDRGYTQAEVAETLGVSVSTLRTALE